MIHATRRKPGALLAAMIALVAALLALATVQNHRMRALSQQVSAAYEKSLYESVALMNGIQLNLEKLLVSSDGRNEEQLLTTISQQSEGAQSNLSSIPLSPELLSGAMKFVNQMGDYAKTLAKQLMGGGKLHERDVQQLIAMHDSSVELNQGLFDILGQYERSEVAFEVPEDLQSAAKDISTKVEPMVDYPVLLYDGPFSDADRTAVPLSGDVVDVITAQSNLIDYIGEDRVKSVQYTGESDILGKCYEFEVQTGDGLLAAVVTERGSHVLYVLPETDIAEPKLTQGECIDMAQRFLQSRGYGTMEVSYWRQLGGLLTINFAASQDGVLMYPDLVKVQVSMQSGLVVGIEAGNYLKNHRTRYLAEPMFTSEMALQRLSAVLTSDRIRQCVIPLDSGREAQCWEITAHMEGGNRYLVYMDVLSGEERSILRIMVEEDGVLAQ